MSRFWILTGAALGLLLILFLAAESVGIPILQNPVPAMRSNPAAAAAVGFTLLVVDAVAPVPSSIVMIALGAMFGMPGGALISLVGSLCGAMLGFAIGRAGRRILNPGDREQAERLLQKWGPIAVVVTRPVPLLAETVAIAAGAGGMRLRKLAFCSTLGALPAA